MRFHPFRLLQGAIFATCALAGCGGGTSSPPARFLPTPSPTPAGATTTVPIPTNGSIVLPTVAGRGVTLSFGTGVPSGATLTVTESTTPPSGVPAPSSVRRTRSLPGAISFYYLTFTSASNLPVSALTSETISLLPVDPQSGVLYYFELDDVTPPGSVVLARCGPATASNYAAAISTSACTATGTLLTTTDTYVEQFYYIPSTSATPAPTSSPSPTLSPSPAPTGSASPATIVEESTGISSSQSQPLGITSANGALWVTARQYGGIVDVPTSGSPYVCPTGGANSVGGASNPTGIAAGPDGNLYVAMQSATPYIDQFSNNLSTPGGSCVNTIFETPNQATPFSVAAGSDGNLWFTEQLNGTAAIAAVSTTGSFSVLTPVTLPSSTTTLPLGVGITSGPDGALWFTESSAGKIGRITTSGAVTEYASGVSSGAQPYGITTGPDGALWFTENGTSKIGRITTAGVVTEFAIPTTSSAPVGIVTGADGALWFTESSGNKIGRVTTAGAFSETAVPTASSQPWGIALGPDGHIWFTERAANQVGTVH